jgi:hypothetical protein
MKGRIEYLQHLMVLAFERMLGYSSPLTIHPPLSFYWRRSRWEAGKLQNHYPYAHECKEKKDG